MDARLSYRESAVRGASPVRLVILLYEQVIDDMRGALAAQGRGDIEGRTRAINHAIVVISHLQATLDKEHGGRVAEDLERFYAQIRAGLCEAQTRQSASLLEGQISLVTVVHEAWREVEQAEIGSPAKRAGSMLNPEAVSRPGGWRA